MRRVLSTAQQRVTCTVTLALALAAVAGVASADESALERRRTPIVQPDLRSGVGAQAPDPASDMIPIGLPQQPRDRDRDPQERDAISGDGGLWTWFDRLVVRIQAQFE